MDADELFDNRQRFAAVMKARRNDKELIELFHKLVLSDKFSDDAKPYCYADLVVEAARRIADGNLGLLMQTLEDRSAPKKIRLGIPHEKAEVAMRALMKRVFASTPMESDPMLKVFLWSERIGVAMDRGHTVCLGLEGGITMDVMDDICDLTVYQYYPSLPRPKPRPQLQPELLAPTPELLAA
jgi:hypothetical protein